MAANEKARFYATRIAQTETFRAKNYKNAKDYLEDDELELVKFEMSSYHPKVDICDFYAKLDIGYGRGVVPKEQMRTLPLHPFCRCRYRPYYLPPHKRVKRVLSFKEAAKKTMERFSDYEKKEILGGRARLLHFEAGEDIERLFNAVRPKYPIRRVVEVLGYNKTMRMIRDDEIKEFLRLDEKILSSIVQIDIGNFRDLWINENEFKKHIMKRLKEGVVKDEEEYMQKVKECVLEPDEIYLKKYTAQVKKRFDRWDRIYYKKENMWVAIFNEKGKINTAYLITKDFNDILFKGDVAYFDIIKIDPKELRDGRENK